jgi:gag-polypeptide of LTR copia-type/Zinc knuckle
VEDPDVATLGSNKGVMQHLNGTVRVPDPLPTHDANTVITESEEEAYDKAERHWDDYYQCFALIKAQIYTTIPEVLLIEVRKLSTAKETWDAVCTKHEHTALTVKVDICRRMYKMKCEDDSNVCTHLEAMMSMQEQLVGMEAGLMDDELITLILRSLPKSYRALINAISLSARHAQIKLGPHAIVTSLLEEFDRLKIEECQLKASESTLAAEKGCGKGHCTGGNSKSKKLDIKCWKCSKTGHVKADCNEKEEKGGR